MPVVRTYLTRFRPISGTKHHPFITNRTKFTLGVDNYVRSAPERVNHSALPHAQSRMEATSISHVLRQSLNFDGF